MSPGGQLLSEAGPVRSREWWQWSHMGWRVREAGKGPAPLWAAAGILRDTGQMCTDLPRQPPWEGRPADDSRDVETKKNNYPPSVNRKEINTRMSNCPLIAS